MKKLFIGTLALASLLSAHASMLEDNGPLDSKFHDAQLSDEKTYFETLGDLFNAGTRPNLLRISNIAWSGRCFLKRKPNDPTNGGYIFRKKRSDAGPLSSQVVAYEAFSYWHLSMAPDFFDHMDIEQVFAAVPAATAGDVRLKEDSIEIGLRGQDKSNLKVSGNYLVEEISGPATNVGPLARFGVEARCYYFIPDLNG